jgi:hypothetical protein
MGDTVSKAMKDNSCVRNDDAMQIPRYHFKCRFDSEDNYSKTQPYTRTKDILVSHFFYPEIGIKLTHLIFENRLDELAFKVFDSKANSSNRYWRK